VFCQKAKKLELWAMLQSRTSVIAEATKVCNLTEALILGPSYSRTVPGRRWEGGKEINRHACHLFQANRFMTILHFENEAGEVH